MLVSATPIRICAAPMTQRLLVATMVTAPTAMPPTASTRANRLAVERSTSAPIGVVAISPAMPASDMARPVDTGSKPLACR